MTSLTATPDGVLLVDKAAGMTSHDVVAIVRRRLQMKKVGHCGTLDPIATGLLLLTLGRGTKNPGPLASEDKEYAGTVILGVITDTRDRAGVTLQERPVPPLDEANVRAAFEKYSGDFYQMPPMVSAIKKDGVPLYKLAPRQNRRARAAPGARLSLFDRPDRVAGNRFQRRLQQRLLCSHLRARHRRDARLRRASQGFAAGKIGTVQCRGAITVYLLKNGESVDILSRILIAAGSLLMRGA